MAVELSQYMNSLSLRETSVRDLEPNSYLHKIYDNTNIVLDFFKKFHTIPDIIKFISTNVYAYRMYLQTDIFNQQYTDVSESFLKDLQDFKYGLQFFIFHYNKENFEYNSEFIINFNEKFQDFLYLHIYDTGYLL